MSFISKTRAGLTFLNYLLSHFSIGYHINFPHEVRALHKRSPTSFLFFSTQARTFSSLLVALEFVFSASHPWPHLCLFGTESHWKRQLFRSKIQFERNQNTSDLHINAFKFDIDNSSIPKSILMDSWKWILSTATNDYWKHGIARCNYIHLPLHHKGERKLQIHISWNLNFARRGTARIHCVGFTKKKRNNSFEISMRQSATKSPNNGKNTST